MAWRPEEVRRRPHITPIEQQVPLSQPQDRYLPTTPQSKSDRPKSGAKQINGTHMSSWSSFPAMLGALNTMQSHFFEIWQGTWPQASDWTAAVMGTHISSTLNAITSSKTHDTSKKRSSGENQPSWRENEINRYFTHLTSFYFGENAFQLRGQAYDDMLWVVLGWLESVKLIRLHSNLHYKNPSGATDDIYNTSAWYANQFVPAFAHRARIFYDLASAGWDERLCGGGMIWSPWLAPYKNAITNQLYIAASVSMYLYFPGDTNSSPFVGASSLTGINDGGDDLPSDVPAGETATAHDPKYLENAVETYRWLIRSNMTNSMGLFVDGYHIRGWRGGRKGGSTGTEKCDLREESVYSYNQGVLLSGLRGLWEATGKQTYLEDGHRLIRNTIAATGFHTIHDPDNNKWTWHGIGRNGVLEERCDIRGSCGQDGQNFKGIYFHHLTLFCAPLPIGEKEGIYFKADPALAGLHRQSCNEYGDWIRHNAIAAYGTRDDDGVFGMWWGWGLKSTVEDGGSVRTGGDSDDDLRHIPTDKDGDTEADPGNDTNTNTDYRNTGVPLNAIWRLANDPALIDAAGFTASEASTNNDRSIVFSHLELGRDPNDRGRGRTIETQSGGLAVLKALWRLVDSGEGD
ncbi:hypothetical protein MMC09_002472 [Bachmanniomyces sp. S44760]|nr:hypothetical protein [Bachmanniomyces sp. S44760]